MEEEATTHLRGLTNRVGSRAVVLRCWAREVQLDGEKS